MTKQNKILNMIIIVPHTKQRYHPPHKTTGLLTLIGETANIK